MRRLGPSLAAAAIALLLAVPAAMAAREQRVREGAPETPATVFSPDRVIVQWAGGASRGARTTARDKADVEFSRDLGSRRFQLVETEPGQSPRQAIRELEANPAVAGAERDGYDVPNSLPDDPLLGQLWGLLNTGAGIGGFSGAIAGDDIDAGDAWDRTIGDPATVVADIDSGYRFEHPDLAGVAWTNPGETPNDGIDNDHNGFVDDVHGFDFVGPDAEAPAKDGDPTDEDLLTGGHGVHTAGTIGAAGNNGIGITGVAQNVRIMPLRACSHFPSLGDNRCPFSAEVEAIEYAGEMGARVANMSLGGTFNSVSVRDAIAANPQTLFVISAGNDSQDNDAAPHYPCNYNPLGEAKSAVDNVICVAATNQADQLAGFSDWGAHSVDLGAPGTETLSTYPVRRFLDDDFEVDDFASKWTASGTDGGFARTNEAPLTSFGISDSPGATPVANSVRASTSAPVTMPAGFDDCRLEQTRFLSVGGGAFRYEVLLDGNPVKGATVSASGRFFLDLEDKLIAGGQLTVSFRYTAGNAPEASDGAWVDDVDLHCTEPVGQASGYEFLQGTSMAAPHVSGAAALIFSLKPTATVTEVRQGLLGSVDPVASLAGKTTTGGRLDAGAATDLFDPAPPPAPTLSATNPVSPANDNSPELIGSAQAGTTIAVYADASCSGPPVATGSAADLGAGIAVSVADNTTTEFSVTATDLAPSTSACSAPIAYVEETDAVPPAAPQLLGTDPASPGTSGTPRILGSAEAGSTIALYAGPSCAGPPVAAGSAAELESPGLLVTVAEGATAEFSATATDVATNTSDCSDPISYTHQGDTSAPAAPQNLTTSPASPGTSGTPRILGSAEAGSTIALYAGPSCAGSPLTTGSAAELESPGLLVAVAEGATGTFSATATDAASNTSTCSDPISYTHTKPASDPGGGDSGSGGGGGGSNPATESPPSSPPPTLSVPPVIPQPLCTVPRLAGKTLPRAKRALASSHCTLGVVRKPRPRRGKAPRLVVRVSTPSAGTQSRSGKVNLTLGPKPRKKHR